MHPTPEQQAADENTPPQQLRMVVNQSIEILRLVAQNPNTEPELLKELGDTSCIKNMPAYIRILQGSNIYKAIREAVASNPNTPTDVLLELGAEFPEQLLDNPVFSLLMLENPNIISDMPWQTIDSLERYSGTPAELRKRLDELQDIPF